jgi:hypothetical protein
MPPFPRQSRPHPVRDQQQEQEDAFAAEAAKVVFVVLTWIPPAPWLASVASLF